MSILATAIESAKQRLNLTKFFLRNAAAKHGVPWEESTEIPTAEVKVTVENKTPPMVVSPVTDVAKAVSTAVQSDTAKALKEDAKSWAKKLLIGGSFGGGSLLAGLLGGWLASKPATPTQPPAQPPIQPPAVQVPADGSLLQYLQDKGMHLPQKK